MNLNAKKLEFQVMLFVAVEEMARRRLDLLARVLHQRSSSAAVSPADLIIFAAVFSGIPDNSDLHRSGSEAPSAPEHPNASEFLKLSASHHSIYRLLSIQLVPHFEHDKVLLEAIYAGFAMDEDPYVKEVARERVESSSSPNKAEMLRRFESP